MFTLIVDTLRAIEDIHPQILVVKVHDNITLLWGVDSLLGTDSKIKSTMGTKSGEATSAVS